MKITIPLNGVAENSTLRRMLRYMPQYHDKKEWNERGAVKITPLPFARSLPILKHVLPYHVGDVVQFRISIEKPNPSPGLMSHYVFEKMPDEDLRQLQKIDGAENIITGNITSAEGDVKYLIGLHERNGNIQRDVVFSTKLKNWDTIIREWFYIVLAAFLGMCFGMFIGFLQIDPAWRIWCPEWIKMCAK